jgi:protein-tyrosine phosphatase
MPSDEMASNGVTDLPDICSSIGLQWFHFPIEDDTSPGEVFRRSWETGKSRVFEILDRSGTVAIHCKGGSGRTSLMAAVILCERGMKHDQILQQVKALRPYALRLPVHMDYLDQLCAAQEGRSFTEM